MEGDLTWVKTTLDNSFLQVGEPFTTGKDNSITEVTRIREIIDPVTNEPVKPDPFAGAKHG